MVGGGAESAYLTALREHGEGSHILDCLSEQRMAYWTHSPGQGRSR
jgi:hypothetical protein